MSDLVAEKSHDFGQDGLGASPGQRDPSPAMAVVVHRVAPTAYGLCLEPDASAHRPEADAVREDRNSG